MDDRRYPINNTQTPISPPSREPKIGEALMRVSNTLEAQRLTKSLDYQEKLRSRANIRMIIAIVCLCVALGCLLVGGFLLIVLIKYEDPILDTIVPFLKSTMNGMNASSMAAAEAATYQPLLKELNLRQMQFNLQKLESAGAVDFAGVAENIKTLLGNATGMIGDLRGAIGTVANSASETIYEVGNNISSAIS